MRNQMVVLTIAVSLLFGMTIILSASYVNEISASESSGENLNQIPSIATDYPNNDPNAVGVHVTTANKDSIDNYHVRGEIKNLGSEPLQYVKVTGHFYDAQNQTVGFTSCCYTDPKDIEAGHTATFDSFAQKDEMSGDATAFRLSFDW